MSALFIHQTYFQSVSTVAYNNGLSQQATIGSKCGALFWLRSLTLKHDWLKSQPAAFAMLDYLGLKSALNLMYQCDGLLRSL